MLSRPSTSGSTTNEGCARLRSACAELKSAKSERARGHAQRSARAGGAARDAHPAEGDGARAFLDRNRDALRARAEAAVAGDAMAGAVREQALVARVARPEVHLGAAEHPAASPGLPRRTRQLLQKTFRVVKKVT